MTEPEIIAGCQRGDDQARRELYVQTSDRVYRLLLRLTRDRETAFDLSQDTYVRAFTSIGGFSGRASLATWLYRIAVNEALQYLRRGKRWSGALASARRYARDHTEDIVSTRLDLERALAELGATDRAILLLRYQEGLDYRAISQVLGCRAGTVASRLNRARERVRALLAAGYAEENSAAAHPTRVVEPARPESLRAETDG